VDIEGSFWIFGGNGFDNGKERAQYDIIILFI
jgi:hypothetical protein